jgi:cytidylate kinase
MSSERVAPRVVTISAAYGAGGSVVGPRLADRLHVPFVDRAIPAAVSARLAVPLDEALAREELSQGTLGRLIAHLTPATLAVHGVPVSPELAQDDQTFRAATERVLHECAAAGAIILGRAAAVVLREVPHALHVRLDGPREARILQAMRLQGIDRASAEHQLRAADASREAYVGQWYHVDPGDPNLYHLLIDSTAIDLDACVELIAAAAASRTPRARNDALADRGRGRHEL